MTKPLTLMKAKRYSPQYLNKAYSCFNPLLIHIHWKEAESSSGGSEGELRSTSEASYSYHDAEQYLEASEPRVNVQHLEGVRLRDYVHKQRELYR